MTGSGFLRLSSSGKWVGVLKYRDPVGDWRQITKTLSPDRDAAELMMAEWLTKMSDSLPISETTRQTAAPTETKQGERNHAIMSETSVGDAVRSLLSAQLARGRIERSTHDMQLAYCERDLFPAIGHVQLRSLGPAQLQAWVDSLCMRMSSGSARIPYSVLSKALQQAVRTGAIDRNPLDRVEPPARVRPSRISLPADSVARLERAMISKWGSGSAMTCAVLLALNAGLRAGECCGLRWRDIDLPSRRIRVTASVGRTDGGIYLKGPKSTSSIREFPVTSTLADSLVVRRQAVRSVSGEVQPQWFVCGERERPTDPRRLSCKFANLCEDSGITDNEGHRATFHELRHTFATRAVRAGVDIRTLADMLGHASAQLTLDVYASSDEDAKAAAVARLESNGGRLTSARP